MSGRTIRNEVIWEGQHRYNETLHLRVVAVDEEGDFRAPDKEPEEYVKGRLSRLAYEGGYASATGEIGWAFCGDKERLEILEQLCRQSANLLPSWFVDEATFDL